MADVVQTMRVIINRVLLLLLSRLLAGVWVREVRVRRMVVMAFVDVAWAVLQFGSLGFAGFGHGLR